MHADKSDILSARRPIRLDGGKIKAVCAEKYTALSCMHSSQHPATVTPSGFFDKRNYKMNTENLNRNINMSSLGLIRGSSGNKALDTTGFPLSLRSAGMTESTCHPCESGDLVRFPVKRGMTGESGRTLLETLATLGIVILLGVGVIKSYHFIVGQTKAQNTAKMIKTLALERQNMAMGERTGLRVKVKGPHSDLYVENGVPGKHSKYFWVETTLKDESFCNALKDSGMIGADLIEVDDVINGKCGDHSKLVFYFKKNTSSDENLTWVDGQGKVQKCPTGSSMCDGEGNATACEEGYYLTMGECSKCGAHVATCEDENIPLTCMDGYELHWGECIQPPQACTTDKQCDVCGECDTETGYCKGECEKPKHGCSGEGECGKNECMVCDINTHTCRNACTKVDFLRSTGTQWIDTGIIGDATTKWVVSGALFGSSDAFRVYMGQTYENSTTAKNRFAFGYDSNTDTWYCGLGDKNYSSLGASNTNNHIFIVDAANKKFWVDNTSYNINWTSFQNPSTILSGIGLFGRLMADTGNVIPYISAKIKLSQIYKDGILLRDFVPVSSPKGNCMFDKVTQKLFCNQGTGDDFLTD